MYTIRHNKQNRGFTLVELSIVIIIIGFLIAGVAAGQSLIKQAQLNSLIDDITEMNTAIHTFKMTYGYLPGDFPNATAYWPSEACYNFGSISCNGNGNGLIDYEDSFAWDHLNQAKIMLSTYYPQPNFPTGDKLIRYGHGTVAHIQSWAIFYYGNDLNNKNVINIYTDATYPSFNYPNSFIPADLSNIDIKMDDGNPSSGKLMTDGPSSPGCTLEADGVTPNNYYSYPYNDAKYALGNNNTGCSEILYILD